MDGGQREDRDMALEQIRTRLDDSAAALDQSVDRMVNGLQQLDSSIGRLADLADRWDAAALKLDEHSPALAAQARELATTIRTGCAKTSVWAEHQGGFAGAAGRLADEVRDL